MPFAFPSESAFTFAGIRIWLAPAEQRSSTPCSQTAAVSDDFRQRDRAIGRIQLELDEPVHAPGSFCLWKYLLLRLCFGGDTHPNNSVALLVAIAISLWALQ
jgi:hypothetical protein